MDALHLSPKTLTQIEKNKGIYLIGLKENQKELLANMNRASQTLKTTGSFSELAKGHGRIEKRKYAYPDMDGQLHTYNIENEYFDERWEEANFQTLIKVNRDIYDCKKKTAYNETAFYTSNQSVKNTADFQLPHAIRGHWQVETNNHIRDVTLRKDKQRTLKISVTKMLSLCKALFINFLNKL